MASNINLTILILIFHLILLTLNFEILEMITDFEQKNQFTKKDFLGYRDNIWSERYCSIIQKYIDGKLYHCEMMVNHNEVIYSQARQYSYPNHKLLEGKIIASFPIDNDELRREIEDKAHRVQKSLKFKNGIMHTEFFVDLKGDIKFLETNIRQAGGGINLIHKKRLGISLETAMILLEAEQDLYVQVRTSKHHTSGYIPMKKGRVVGFMEPDLVGDVEFQKKVKIGDTCHSPKSASNAALSYIGEYDSIKEIKDDFKFLESYNTVMYEI